MHKLIRVHALSMRYRAYVSIDVGLGFRSEEQAVCSQSYPSYRDSNNFNNVDHKYVLISLSYTEVKLIKS